MQSPINYSKNARPEYAGLRSADHSTRLEGTANARPFAAYDISAPETGLEILLKAGVTAPPKVVSRNAKRSAQRSAQ